MTLRRMIRARAASLRAGAAGLGVVGLAVAGWVAMTASPAQAQQIFDLTQSGGAPMQIQAAEALEWRQEQRQFVAIGDAVVTRGDVVISARQMTADYRDGANGEMEIYRFTAEGGVVIERGQERITGGLAVYDVDRALFTMTGGNLSLTDGEATITATRSLEYRERDGVAVALGNVHVRNDDQDLWAERVTGRFRSTGGDTPELSFVEAEGGVRIESPTDIITGNSGTFDLQTQIATMTGAVKLTRGSNQLNGEYAEINLETGISRLTGAPSGGRVSGLLVPAEEGGAAGAADQ